MSGEFNTQLGLKIKEVMKEIKESPSDPLQSKHPDLVDKDKMSNIDNKRRGESISDVFAKSQELHNLYIKKISKLSKKTGEEQRELAEEIEEELLELLGEFNLQYEMLSNATKKKKFGTASAADYLQLIAVSWRIYNKVLDPILSGGATSVDNRTDSSAVEEDDDEERERLERENFTSFLKRRVTSINSVLDYHISKKAAFKKDDFAESLKVLLVGKTPDDLEEAGYEDIIERLNLDDSVLRQLESLLDIIRNYQKGDELPFGYDPDDDEADPPVLEVNNFTDSIRDLRRLKTSILRNQDISSNPELVRMVGDLFSLVEKYLTYLNDTDDFDVDPNTDNVKAFLHRNGEVSKFKQFIDKFDPANMKKYSTEELKGIKEELEKYFLEAIPFLSPWLWVAYKEIPGEVVELYKKYHILAGSIEMLLDPTFSSISMRDAAKRVLALDKDIFKYQEMKNPNTSITDKDSLLFKRYNYMAGTSVFSDAFGVLGKDYFSQLTIDLFKEGELVVFEEDVDGVPEKKTNNEKAVELLLAYFKAMFDRREPMAAYTKLIREMASFGKSEDEVKEWGMKVYKELAREEEERNYWKVRVQLYFAKKEMEENKSSAVPRSRLYSELTRVIFDRDEMIKASTGHSEYGQDISNMLDYVKGHASMVNGEVVVKRKMIRETLDPQGKKTEEQLEILHKIKKPEKMEWDEFVRLLRSEGEEIVYLRTPDGKDAKGRRVASYEDLSNMADGGKTLSDEFSTKFPDSSPEAREMAKLMFIAFVQLDPVLGELQGNTKTPAHNGSDKDADRVSLKDPMKGAAHRMFRYDKLAGRDPASNFLSVLEPLPGAQMGIYSEEELIKLGYKDKSKYFTAGGRKVREDLMPFYGKTKKDHGWWAGAQLAAKEYLNRFFDTFKAPKVRVRGFSETLGFDTEMFYKLAPVGQTSSGKPEVVFNVVKGLLDKSGKNVANGEIKDLKSLMDLPAKAEVTTWNFYQLAEELGFLKILEMFNGPVTSGEGHSLSEDDVLAKLDDMWATWGKVKMFPSPVIREAFVAISYEFIMRLVHASENVEEGAQETEDLFNSIISSLVSNMLNNGGLASYQKEMVTLINLLCHEPVFRYNEQTKKAEEISGAHMEYSASWLNSGDRYLEDERFVLTSFVHVLFTKAYRTKDIMNDRIFNQIIKERPKMLLAGFGKLARWDGLDKALNHFGLADREILKVKAMLAGKMAVRPVFNRDGKPMNKPEEKEGK